MAHPEQALFVSHCKRFFPGWFSRVAVLEIGSLDINGSVRRFFDNCHYIGIDLGEGAGVDVVASGQTYAGPTQGFDTIISCEAMEHNPHWQDTFHNALRMLKPHGMMIITCASLGRHQHGTANTTPGDSPLTAVAGSDYYRNLAEADFRALGDFDQWFSHHAFFVDHVIRDLYFVGFGRSATQHIEAVPPFTMEMEHYLRLRNTLGLW